MHTPPNLWTIYKSDYNSLESEHIILLNYPGEKINLTLESNKRIYLKSGICTSTV